eukprot:4221850-Lingulodinium_polyedra.AAC.1
MRSNARFAVSSRRMCSARARHARAISWCARGACVRGAFRRVEAANRASDRIVAQRFSKHCAKVRSNAHFAVAAR